jgi:hypothetical protein
LVIATPSEGLQSQPLDAAPFVEHPQRVGRSIRSPGALRIRARRVVGCHCRHLVVGTARARWRMQRRVPTGLRRIKVTQGSVTRHTQLHRAESRAAAAFRRQEMAERMLRSGVLKPHERLNARALLLSEGMDHILTQRARKAAQHGGPTCGTAHEQRHGDPMLGRRRDGRRASSEKEHDRDE